MTATVKTATSENEIAAPILSRPIFKSLAIIGIRGPVIPAAIPRSNLWAKEYINIFPEFTLGKSTFFPAGRIIIGASVCHTLFSLIPI